MKTVISGNGQIVLPAELRRQDGIRAGQEFEVQRIDQGEYLSKRTKGWRNEGLVELLLACPVKGCCQPASRTETTDDFSVPELVADLKRKGQVMPVLDRTA